MVVKYDYHSRFQTVTTHANVIIHFVSLFELLCFSLCSDGQLYVIILRNQQRSSSTGPVGAEIVLYQLQRLVSDCMLCISNIMR